MHDLVIQGGTVVDGTGGATRTADVAISDGIITEVGQVDGPATRDHRRRRPAYVTPGFVDIHTHYDGQVTWDPMLTPSCWHGVTTVVMGNCGVGFAPGAPRPARVAHRPDGGRRGHPRRRAGRGHPLGLGDRTPSTSTSSTTCPRPSTSGRSGPPRRRAGLRDGRARGPQRAGHARRHRGHGRDRARGACWPAPSASRRRAPSPTWPSTASPSRARSRPRTSCSASAACSATWAWASSSWPRPAPWARTSPRPTRRWPGCGAGRRDRAAGGVRPHPERPRPRRLAAHARPQRPGPGRRRRRAPPGGGPADQPAARPADLPPLRLLPVVGPARHGVGRGEAGGHARPRAAGAACWPRPPTSTRRSSSSSTRRKAYPMGDVPDYEPDPCRLDRRPGRPPRRHRRWRSTTTS